MAKLRGRPYFLVLSGMDSANECCQIGEHSPKDWTESDGAQIQLCPADLTFFFFY